MATLLPPTLHALSLYLQRDTLSRGCWREPILQMDQLRSERKEKMPEAAGHRGKGETVLSGSSRPRKLGSEYRSLGTAQSCLQPQPPTPTWPGQRFYERPKPNLGKVPPNLTLIENVRAGRSLPVKGSPFIPFFNTCVCTLHAPGTGPRIASTHQRSKPIEPSCLHGTSILGQ